MKKKAKYYVVWKGRKTGVFNSWAACKASVDGFAAAKFKSFESKASAEVASQTPYQQHLSYRKSQPAKPKPKASVLAQMTTPFLCVDAACSGNPGPTEYRGIWVDGLSLEKRKQVFHQKFERGTNNIGEFLALVHAMAWLKIQKRIDIAIYSDSKIAMSWVKKKSCKTLLKPSPMLGDLIARGETWLEENDISQFNIKKWHTEHWGEIPADFGRK